MKPTRADGNNLNIFLNALHQTLAATLLEFATPWWHKNQKHV